MNLKLATFRKHKYADSKRVPARRRSAFSEVRLETMPGTITVRTLAGVVVEVPVSIGMSAVVQLVKALQHEH
jgi:hypothetical protein